MELAPSVLDNEWLSLATTSAALTPEPYEDLDPSFVHTKWGIEVNTTRRSDHSAKYKVSWGPFIASRLDRLDFKSSQSAAGLVGPGAPQFLTTKAAQDMAIFNESVLPYKNSSGMSPLVSDSFFGKFAIGRRFGPALFNSVVPKSSQKTNTAALVRSLLPSAPLDSVLLYSNSAEKTRSHWLDMWRFRSSLSDNNAVATKTNSSLYPSYWMTQGLIILSLRQELTENLRIATNKKLGINKSPAGGGHPLMKDIINLHALNSPSLEKRDLSLQG